MKVFTMMMSILLMLSIGASAKTLKLFDEEEDFCGKLVDGTKAEVEKTDVFAGKIALKVGPNGQSVAPSIDGWDIKFGNGEGDYKFIMFAWKKKGGNQMQIQFGFDGCWTFRYHAGKTVYDPSIAVSDKVPTEWTLVIRNMVEDNGGAAMRFNGIAFTPQDGEGLLDAFYIGDNQKELEDLAKLIANKKNNP